MNKQLLNFGYMLAWVVVATLILNPTTAYQIKSNLVAWFQAVSSTDTNKAENNIVALWADSKLPSDVIPAEAASTSADAMYFCSSHLEMSGVPTATCPTGYSKMTFSWLANWHQAIFTSPAWSIKSDFNNWWDSDRKMKTVCCVKN